MMAKSVTSGVFVGVALAFGSSVIMYAQAGSSARTLVKEEKLVNFGRDGVATVKITWHMRPPFYGGALPLTFLAGIRGYGVQYGIRSMTWMDLGKFKVTFEMDRSFTPIIPGIARAVGRGGEILAEARATKLVKGSGFEVRETHFSTGGRVAFECRSFFDFRGWKIDEADVRGQKSEEYFFLWSSDH